MKCPKCNKNTENDWNFCAYCQKPLREKCPECGEMEPVGRCVCLKDLGEANIALKNFINKQVGEWRVGLALTLALLLIVVVLILAILFMTSPTYKYIVTGLQYGEFVLIPTIFFIGIVGTVLSAPVFIFGIKLQRNTEARARSTFYKKFP